MTEERDARQDRRDEKKEKERTFRADNRRSVRMQAILSGRPKPKGRKQWRRRAP